MTPIPLRVYHRYRQNVYRQILVDSRDTDYQRILWHPIPGESITDYRLLTVTYGTATALYLAFRVLDQLVNDERAKFLFTVSVLGHQIYDDDCAFGTDSYLSNTRSIITERSLSSSKMGEQRHRSTIRSRSRWPWFSHTKGSSRRWAP